MRTIALAFVASLAVACSNDASVKVKNSAPTGTVGGILFDGTNDMPLAGAEVTVIVAGKKVGTANTMDDGLYSVSGVPAGTYIVNLKKDGYLSAEITGFLDGAIGNFPVDNPSATTATIGLIPSTGTFSVKLVDDSAKPLAGVQLTGRPQIRYVEYVNGVRQQRGSYTVLAMTDTNGNAEFSGLPDYQKLGTLNLTESYQTDPYYTKVDRLWIDVPPIKDMTSGVYLFAGISAFFDVTRVGQQVPTIALAGPNDTISVVDSNIEYLIGMTPSSSRAFSAQLGSVLAQSSAYYVLFNTAIDSDIRVSLTDEQGRIAPVTLNAQVSGNLLIVTPMVTPMGPLPGKRYNLVLSVTALSTAGINNGGNTKQFSATAPFWIQSMQPNITAQQSVGSLSIDKIGNDVVLTFTLSEPVGVGAGSTGALGCVAFYEDADFDGVTDKPVRGEYGTGAALSCESAAGATIDVSSIRPVLSSDSNSPDAGYYQTWQVTLDRTSDNGPCASVLPGSAVCTRPEAGKKMYLLFQKTESNVTVRRPDGRPVTNQIEITLPTFPS